MNKVVDHLREQARSAPTSHGVYIFHGQTNDYPLYIGKSINIRSRLFAHLRNEDETRLLSQTSSISFIQTAGEITSLLLEARMIKEQKPLFNRRLRKLREAFSYVIEGQKLTISPSTKNQYGQNDKIFGLFKNKANATERLRLIADEHKLCLSTIGIDKERAGQACFRHSIKKCAGACCGAETLEVHHDRMISALSTYKISLWPYKGRIALFEKHDDLEEYHILDHWHYLGSQHTLDCINHQFNKQNTAFDADMYKIIVKPILTNSATVIEID